MIERRSSSPKDDGGTNHKSGKSCEKCISKTRRNTSISVLFLKKIRTFFNKIYGISPKNFIKTERVHTLLAHSHVSQKSACLSQQIVFVFHKLMLCSVTVFWWKCVVNVTTQKDWTKRIKQNFYTWNKIYVLKKTVPFCTRRSTQNYFKTCRDSHYKETSANRFSQCIQIKQKMHWITETFFGFSCRISWF